MNQHSFDNISVAAKVHTTQVATSVAMGETPLIQFRSLGPKRPSTTTPIPTPISIDRRLLLRLAGPATAASIRLADVRANPMLTTIQDHLVAVITFVGHDLRQAMVADRRVSLRVLGRMAQVSIT